MLNVKMWLALMQCAPYHTLERLASSTLLSPERMDQIQG